MCFNSCFKFILFLGISIPAFFSFGCSAPVLYDNDPWFGRDKAYHFTACGVIGAGTTYTALSNGANRDTAPLIGISVSVGIGTGKEIYDENVKKTFFSWKDMVWNAIGGVTGSYLVVIAY